MPRSPMPERPAVALPTRLPRWRSMLGGIAWVSVLQYFLMNLITQAAWTTPYSVVTNAISDLGAVHCGTFEGRAVCSPWHAAANTSWSLAGIAIAIGALALWPRFAHRPLARFGAALLTIAGIALCSVGLNPEDASAWHIPSAMTAIAFGLIAILLLGVSQRHLPGWQASGWAGIALGAIGLLSCGTLLVAPFRLFGLFERFAAYPILIWTVVFGWNVLARLIADRNRDQTRTHSSTHPTVATP
ncbi:DUF998 domain-containing protein [Leucobacter japonicus]|uniref:DUF998 domain-containing protein n=1 Tax=Leucobacter japonicus TaxID=1461259 RepID=UPI00138F5151|nr:DUF998 domain-containing protein [Leucobacter japonicus]